MIAKDEISNWINSFITVVSIIEEPVHWSSLKINRLVLYDRDLCHERLKGHTNVILVIYFLLKQLIVTKTGASLGRFCFELRCQRFMVSTVKLLTVGLSDVCESKTDLQLQLLYYFIFHKFFSDNTGKVPRVQGCPFLKLHYTKWSFVTYQVTMKLTVIY